MIFEIYNIIKLIIQPYNVYIQIAIKKCYILGKEIITLMMKLKFSAILKFSNIGRNMRFFLMFVKRGTQTLRSGKISIFNHVRMSGF